MIPSQMKDDINAFLRDNAIWIAIAVTVLIALVIVLIVLLNRKNKVKKDVEVPKEESNDWLNALGGHENILEAQGVGSRLTLKLQDNRLLDENKLKALGATSIIKMSDRTILVVEDRAENILKAISMVNNEK